MKLHVAERSPVGVSVMHPFFMCFLVHTVDTTRTSWVLEQMVKMKQPVILVGESGTSKTATTQNFLKHLNKEAHVRSVCIRDGAPGFAMGLGRAVGRTGRTPVKVKLTHTLGHANKVDLDLRISCGGHRRSVYSQRSLHVCGVRQREATFRSRCHSTQPLGLGSAGLQGISDMFLARTCAFRRWGPSLGAALLGGCSLRSWFSRPAAMT